MWGHWIKQPSRLHEGYGVKCAGVNGGGVVVAGIAADDGADRCRDSK